MEFPANMAVLFLKTILALFGKYSDLLLELHIVGWFWGDFCPYVSKLHRHKKKHD